MYRFICVLLPFLCILHKILNKNSLHHNNLFFYISLHKVFTTNLNIICLKVSLQNQMLKFEKATNLITIPSDIKTCIIPIYVICLLSHSLHCHRLLTDSLYKKRKMIDEFLAPIYDFCFKLFL